MTTTLEIIDTAVKIGLGALITAVFGIWSAQQKARLDRQKSLQDELRTLYRDVVVEMAAANALLEDYLHLAHAPDQSQVPALLSKNSHILNDCSKRVDQAYAFAGLCGDKNIRAAVKACLDSIYVLHSDLASKGDDAEYEPEFLNQCVEKFNQSHEHVLDCLADALARTAA